MQQKVAGIEAELCLWAQQRPWQSCPAAHPAWQEQCLHPGAAALHLGMAFTSYVCSSCRWRGTAAPTSVLLFTCLSKLLQLLEAKPTVSSAAAGFLPPHSCIQLFLAVLPSKSKKNPNELTSRSTKTQHCALSAQSFWLVLPAQRNQMAVVPKLLFQGPFFSLTASSVMYLPTWTTFDSTISSHTT